MPLVERGQSLNTYTLPKIWFKAHTIEFRVCDTNSINKQAYSWLLADQLCKPQDHIKFRNKYEGGLSLHNVVCKSNAILMKAFLETACPNSKFQTSLYHQALLDWHVFNRRDIPNPGNNPYFSKTFFNKIRNAMEKYPKIENATSKQLYNHLLESVIAEPDDSGDYQLKKCRTELLSPLNDWNAQNKVQCT